MTKLSRRILADFTVRSSNVSRLPKSCATSGRSPWRRRQPQELVTAPSTSWNETYNLSRHWNGSISATNMERCTSIPDFPDATSTLMTLDSGIVTVLTNNMFLCFVYYLYSLKHWNNVFFAQVRHKWF